MGEGQEGILDLEQCQELYVFLGGSDGAEPSAAWELSYFHAASLWYNSETWP